MRQVDPAIVRHYESVREEDRISAGFGQLELLRVQQVLRRHLPPAPASILDVGGATGVHARWLADDGYAVQVLDITERHVVMVKEELAGMGVTAEVGDARDIPYPNRSFDSVLVFGPLYHLTERDDRLLALREAARVVRPGGAVAVAAVSRFASLFDGLARELIFDREFVVAARRDLATGQHRNPYEHPHWWTTAYLHRPDELRREIEMSGLALTELVGVEGLAGYLPHLATRWDDPADRETILWSAEAVESEPCLLGLSAHLLAVARASGRRSRVGGGRRTGRPGSPMGGAGAGGAGVAGGGAHGPVYG
jgi:SAM-dependent methyltransferase